MWFSIMNIIRGQRRWSLLTGTTDGLMMIALNGVPIGEFNVQRFSIKWIRDLGHLRCDDFSHVGQPHSTTEPTTENRVDPAGGQSKSTKQSRFLKIKRYLFPDGNNCSRSVETTKLKSNHAL